MRLGKTRFVELCFYKNEYDNVRGYYEDKGSQYYWYEGYSRIHDNIKFWI